jgi:hypothetical protein
MKAPSTHRQGRAAAKPPSTPLRVIYVLLTGLSLHCGTGHEGAGTPGDGGNQSAERDSSSDTGSASASPDGGSSDAQGSPMEADREDGPSAPSVDASTDAPTDASIDAPKDGTSSDTGGPDSSSGAALAFGADRVIVTGVRGIASPAAQSVIVLHNAGQTSARVTGLVLGGANASLFTVTTPVPATIPAASDLQVTVEMTTTGAGLPALPPGPAPYDSGSNALTATLTASSDSGSVQASVFGLLLVQDTAAAGGGPGIVAGYEPTLGQILTALGYPINVGQAQNDWNPNTSMLAQNLPGIEANSDEVAAPLFVKATATGSVTMNVVARFSPVGILPYGWYPSTSSTTRTPVGTMSMVTDPQTSDKARMVYPPLVAGSATAFDPGTSPFGIYVYSDQKKETWNEGGNPVNGDYDFSQDGLNTDNAANTPAVVHRIKTYPLKDATGQVVPRSYLVAVEEAANGDYQDYVFVLGNVDVAP